jgi:Mitochondrial carrier protein
MWDAEVDSVKKDDCCKIDEINKNNKDKVTKECGFELKKVRYRDFFQTIRLVYKAEGLSAFTKGVGPRMCINIPSTALSWGTYELVKSFIAKREHD